MLLKENPADLGYVQSPDRQDKYQRNLIKMCPNEHFAH